MDYVALMTRRRLALILLIIALFTLPPMTGLDFAIGSVYQPPERALWERLHTVHPDATYFESGNALLHQVYADMPQVVDWEDGGNWVRLK
jgi:hypothetical protein